MSANKSCLQLERLSNAINTTSHDNCLARRRTMHKGFKFFFMPEGYDRDDAPQEMTVYNVEDTLIAIQKVLDEFWSLPAKR